MGRKDLERDAVFQPEFREEFPRHWVDSARRVALRMSWIWSRQSCAIPFAASAKPEPLRRRAPDAWSRRVTQEHRLVYMVQADRIDFRQARTTTEVAVPGYRPERPVEKAAV